MRAKGGKDWKVDGCFWEGNMRIWGVGTTTSSWLELTSVEGLELDTVAEL